MGHSQQSKRDTHEKIVAIAAKRLRERGLEGIGVADLMADAGLTVGGFYKHFASRSDLLAQAVTAMNSGWDAVFASAEAQGRGKPQLFDALVDGYLSPAHRDDPENGCLFAALAPEIGRSEDEVRGAATLKLKALLGKLSAVFDDRRAPAARASAILAYAALVGAVSLARATNDPELSQEILATVAKGLKKLLRPAQSP
jgi:TetR/AcrR family transcriptional repressor of nem operon